MGKKQRHLSNHHYIPRSRGGTKTVAIPVKFHQAWHTIFGNLTPDESVFFLIKVIKEMTEREEICETEMETLRKRTKGGRK